MRKTTILLLAVLVMAGTVWGQPASPTKSLDMTGTTSGITFTDLASPGDCTITSASQKGDQLEVVKRCHSNVLYATNPMTAPPDKVTKEIYGARDGKIVLLRTVEAKVIPAQDERVEWPNETTNIVTINGATSDGPTFSFWKEYLPSQLVSGQYPKVTGSGNLSFGTDATLAKPRHRRHRAHRHYAHAQRLSTPSISRYARPAKPSTDEQWCVKQGVWAYVLDGSVTQYSFPVGWQESRQLYYRDRCAGFMKRMAASTRGFVAIEPQSLKNNQVNYRIIEGKRYAHAQQQPKEVASAATPKPTTGPVDIPFPPDEAKMMSDLKAQKDKLGAEFKIAEGQRELDKLKEIYDAGVAAVQKKYVEYGKRVEPLVKQEQLILQLSAIKLGLTEEQTVGPKHWLPQTDEKGAWVWRKPLPTPEVKPAGQ